MKLTDVVSKQACAQLEKSSFFRYGINCTVYDTVGTGITGSPNWCNALCPEIKAHRESHAAICDPANRHFMAQAKRTGKPVIGECDAGFVTIAVPIFLDGEFLGIAAGCGLRPPGGTVEALLVEKTTGLGGERVAELCDGVGTMSDAQAREMAAYLEEQIAIWVKAYRRRSEA